MTTSIGWYVLYVKSRHEKKVYDSLMELSIEAFLPMVKTVTEWSDRRKTIVKPLFTSYVFVKIGSSHDFHTVLSVNGACMYVKFGLEYGLVSEKEIQQVKLITSTPGLEGMESSSILPKVGEKVKITFGPLSGLVCEILKIGNKRKIIVRLNSFKQGITAFIPLNFLEHGPPKCSKIINQKRTVIC